MQQNNQLLSLNATALQLELEWLTVFLNERIRTHQERNFDIKALYSIQPPVFEGDVAASPYAQLVAGYNMDMPERIILLLALLPHIKPELLDIFFTRNDQYGRVFTEFGGVVGNKHNGFMPTGETAMYILAADNLELRFLLSRILSREHFLPWKIYSTWSTSIKQNRK